MIIGLTEKFKESLKALRVVSRMLTVFSPKSIHVEVIFRVFRISTKIKLISKLQKKTFKTQTSCQKHLLAIGSRLLDPQQQNRESS